MVTDLTPEEWQYISVLVAQDVRTDRANKIDLLADEHRKIWEKIQPACRWVEFWDDLEIDEK